MLDGQQTGDFLFCANLFIARDGQFLTPSLQRCGIAGTRRQHRRERLAGVRHMPKVQDLTIDDAHADAVMLTNTVMGVTSVGSIAQQAFNERSYRRIASSSATGVVSDCDGPGAIVTRRAHVVMTPAFLLATRSALLHSEFTAFGCVPSRYLKAKRF